LALVDTAILEIDPDSDFSGRNSQFHGCIMGCGTGDASFLQVVFNRLFNGWGHGCTGRVLGGKMAFIGVGHGGSFLCDQPMVDLVLDHAIGSILIK
jgi:hypothetical protein